MTPAVAVSMDLTGLHERKLNLFDACTDGELMPRVVNICGSSIPITSKICYMHIFWVGIMTDYVLWCLSSRDGSHHNRFLKGVHVRVYVMYMYVYIYICTDWWFQIVFPP